MKWLRTVIVLSKGSTLASTDWSLIHSSYVRSIQSIHFPINSGQLTLRRKVQRPDKQWNRDGVGYLKNQFFGHMVEVEGWHAEVAQDIRIRIPPELMLYPSLIPYQEPITSDFGSFDFVTTSKDKRIAIEWETGNISSSHRSMNKLAISLISGQIQAGVLILPSRSLYEHLTDRIGNISELSGYLTMWKDLEPQVSEGILVISVVEHDSLTDDIEFQYLPSGSDGRAREGNLKRK